MTPNINKILKENPRSCKYGAPLGDCDVVKLDGRPLYVQRVNFVDGDYGPDGTYWGNRLIDGIFCGFNLIPGTNKTDNRIYVRATDRDDAKVKILEKYSTAKFF